MTSTVRAIPSRVISGAPQPSTDFWRPGYSKRVCHRWRLTNVHYAKSRSPIRGNQQPLLGNRVNEVHVIVIEYRATASGVRLGRVSSPPEYFPARIIASNPRVESIGDVEYLSPFVECSTTPLDHFRVWIGTEKEQAAFLIWVKSAFPVAINR